MTAPIEPTPVGPPAPPPAVVPPAVPPAEPAPVGAAAAVPTFDPASLSPEARAYIKAQVDANDLKARTTSKANAAKEAEAALLAKLSAAFGLTPDAATDPAALAEQLSKAQRESRALRVEQAIGRAARKHGADEDLLTAVLAHTGRTATLDPSAEDFATALDALVKSTVDGNPKLRASGAHATAPGAQGATGDFSAGTGAAPITEEQMRAMTPAERAAAYEAGKLAHLL